MNSIEYPLARVICQALRRVVFTYERAACSEIPFLVANMGGPMTVTAAIRMEATTKGILLTFMQRLSVRPMIDTHYYDGGALQALSPVPFRAANASLLRLMSRHCWQEALPEAAKAVAAPTPRSRSRQAPRSSS